MPTKFIVRNCVRLDYPDDTVEAVVNEGVEFSSNSGSHLPNATAHKKFWSRRNSTLRRYLIFQTFGKATEASLAPLMRRARYHHLDTTLLILITVLNVLSFNANRKSEMTLYTENSNFVGIYLSSTLLASFPKYRATCQRWITWWKQQVDVIMKWLVILTCWLVLLY